MPSHRNFIFSPRCLYTAAQITRGITPKTSPGPYTVAQRRLITRVDELAACCASASSACSLYPACFVHGLSLPPSLHALSLGSYTCAVDSSMKCVAPFFTAAAYSPVETPSTFSSYTRSSCPNATPSYVRLYTSV